MNVTNNAKKPGCTPFEASECAGQVKPANEGKLPLPMRYTATPTTGEVLYEYIRISRKLRAAATLNLFDAWLQEEAGWKCSLAKMGELHGFTSVKKSVKSADEATARASLFREKMQKIGVTFPITFFMANPCPLATGKTIRIELEREFTALSVGRRYQRLNKEDQYLWESLLLISRADIADPDDDLKELKASWGDATAKESDLREAFRNALKKRKATLQTKTEGRGRAGTGLLSPKSALNDLWHYLIVRGVAKHTGRSLDDLIAPYDRQGGPRSETLAGMIYDTFDLESIKQAALDPVKEQEGYSVKLNGYHEPTGEQTGHGGELDTKPIKEGARKARDRINAFESECQIPDAAMEEAKWILANYAKIVNAARGKVDEEEELSGCVGTQPPTAEEQIEMEKELDEWLQARASNKVLMPRIPKKPSGQ